MTEYTVKLESINDVKEFVSITNKYIFDIDLMSGRYAIDAKSIMGIFSLDISKPLKMIVHANGEEIEEFADDVKKFIAQ